MTSQSLPSGARLEIFETLDSTSAEAKRRADAGETGPLWIVAVEQTAGYGRRGRAWSSATGNFAGTYLFAPEGDPTSLGQLSYVLALAVHDALTGWAEASDLSVKWPNDILLRDGKVAGLLLERIDRDGRAVVAAGVGVNIVAAPSDTPYRAAKLADVLAETAPPAPRDLAASIDERFAEHYATWRAEGFAPVRAAWLAVAKGLGGPITVRLPGEEIAGVFEGLDETGALVLRVGDATRAIAAGEVMFGDPPADPL